MVDRIGHGQREPADAVSTAVEPIFIAANLREIDFVERLLDGEGIDYTLTPEAFIREGLRGPCFQGLLFEVIADRPIIAAGCCAAAVWIAESFSPISNSDDPNHRVRQAGLKL
jgi:hypothetical protein